MNVGEECNYYTCFLVATVGLLGSLTLNQSATFPYHQSISVASERNNKLLIFVVNLDQAKTAGDNLPQANLQTA